MYVKTYNDCFDRFSCFDFLPNPNHKSSFSMDQQKLDMKITCTYGIDGMCKAAK